MPMPSPRTIKALEPKIQTPPISYDRYLMEQIAESKDRAALSELFYRHQMTIGRFLRRRLSSQALVDHAYNKVMLHTWKEASSYLNDVSVPAWLYRVAYQIRKANQTQNLAGKKPKAAVFASHDKPNLSKLSTQEQLIKRTMNGLTAMQQDVIELSYHHGFCGKEMAFILESTESVVGRELSLARKQLKPIAV